MESGITKEFTPAVAESQNAVNTDSVASFQSFIYELFEKNGILNDLRAYLRGHIVNVLKSAQTGDPPPCQKHFTQRLDLKYQALNILVAEYLMCLEFSYSFSVFISEIPLANMVFSFAKSFLEKTDKNITEMRFKETDIWSILNYLGVQCDSEHALNIVEMYKNEKHQPLLLCILKCMPMYKEFVGVAKTAVSSEESLASTKSLDNAENKDQHSKNSLMVETCKHPAYCKRCQNKINRLKDLYKKKKKHLAKINQSVNADINPMNTESLVQSVSVMEKNLVEEMFQQLKSVYETEVEMVKVEEEKKVKRSMTTQVQMLQKKQDEMEETFKAREAELEQNVQQKKQFLWGLARALRDQHQHMTRAMHDVREETQRLELKEDSLKTQLAEAEDILKKRGEEVRTQIANELTILEGHLESMKKERENITRERSELENLKTIHEKHSNHMKEFNIDSEQVNSHYDLLKNELAILKKYLESSRVQAKCVIERGTVTEPVDYGSKVALNNSQSSEKCSKSDDLDDRLKTNQVVNDFRKKNVNFSQSNLDELYRDRNRARSRSSNSSEAGDTAAPDLDLERGRDRDLIQQLREENDRLKEFARQQRSHIEQLSTAPPRCTRPHTAPSAPAHHVHNLHSSASANALNVGWRKGAGEELSIFSNAQPRILVPGDTIPFIGVLRDRHGNARRPLTFQARACRARPGPLAGVIKRTVSPLRDRHAICGGSGLGLRVNGTRSPNASCSLQPDEEIYRSIREKLQQRPRPALSLEINRNREKSPKTMLKEVKKKLRKQDSARNSPAGSRSRSPSAVLREAKRRLRKLEIEAEAVERSYLDFRRRQSERGRTQHRDLYKDVEKVIDVKQNYSIHKLDDTMKNDIEAQFAALQKSVRNDFDKYILDYKNKFDISETHFKPKPTVSDKVKPIPEIYSTAVKDYNDAHGNYLETPLTEFRKLYTSARQSRRDESEIKSPTRSSHSENTSVVSKNDLDYENGGRHDVERKNHYKQAELQILKDNISKMYNLPNDNFDSATTVEQVNRSQTFSKSEDENTLRVEVESINEMNHIASSQTQELLLVVQSSGQEREMTLTGLKPRNEVVSAQMTIIVSPKISPKSEEVVSNKSSDRPKRSVTPEQAAHLTRNDVLDAIFHADPNNYISSVQMQLDLSKDVLEDSVSEYGKEEYPDDFSADVDNYNSNSVFENNSPISLPKTPEDDNFWDS